MSISASSVTPLFEVFDMRRSVAFYCDLLGFSLIDKYEPDGNLYWAMLRLGGATIMLNARCEATDQPAQADPKLRPGHADTTLFFMCDDVDAAYAHVRAKGIAAKEPANTHYGMRQLYFTDPDGFQLCFQQRID
jgi:glyoxylase I family protein